MTYLEHITTYFIGLVGRGSALSSADLALVRQWEAAGIPADAVCRAIRRVAGGRRAAGGRRVTLSDCAASLTPQAPPRDAAKRPPERKPGSPSEGTPEGTPEELGDMGDTWTPQRLCEQLETIGKLTEEGPVREAYRAVYRLVTVMPPKPLGVTEVARLDDLTLRELERKLDSAKRSRLRANARREARSLLGTGASRDAVERLTRGLLERTCCETFGLVLPSTLLTESTPS